MTLLLRPIFCLWRRSRSFMNGMMIQRTIHDQGKLKQFKVIFQHEKWNAFLQCAIIFCLLLFLLSQCAIMIGFIILFSDKCLAIMYHQLIKVISSWKSYKVFVFISCLWCIFSLFVLLKKSINTSAKVNNFSKNCDIRVYNVLANAG